MQSRPKTVEETAGEIWRLVKHELEKNGFTFPNNFDAIGSAYGSYARIGELLHQRDVEIFEATKQRVLEAIEESNKGMSYSDQTDEYARTLVGGNINRIVGVIENLTLSDVEQERGV